jgi:phage recombination protein Bet
MSTNKPQSITSQREAPRTTSLLARIADRYHVDPDKMALTLKATAFRSKSGEISNEQLMMLLVVADQHKLNPFTAEIFAFPSSERGIVPIVSVDGWTRIINEHPQLAGFGFEYAEDGSWIECIIERKDRTQPVRVREYMSECARNTGPWTSHPQRMLRHKALIQAARLAFGFAGIYDPDEGERIIEATDSSVVRGKPRTIPPREISLTPQVITAEPLPDPVADAAKPAAETPEVEVPKGKDPHLMLIKALDKSGVSLKALVEHLQIDPAFEVFEVSEIPVKLVPKALGWLKEVAGA